MPRLRQVVKGLPMVAADGVPVEFATVDDPVWASAESARAFMEQNGFVLPGVTGLQFLAHGPASRYKVAAEAWAVGRGLGPVDKWGRSRVDWAALRGAGFADVVVAARRERWQFVGAKYGGK